MYAIRSYYEPIDEETRPLVVENEPVEPGREWISNRINPVGAGRGDTDSLPSYNFV